MYPLVRRPTRPPASQSRIRRVLRNVNRSEIEAMSDAAAAAPQNPSVRKDRKEMGPWRGTKPAGFILNPGLFMRECVGLKVSVRVMNGAKWRGVLREVRDNGDVVIRPAQELLYDEPDGDELPEKLLVKSDILWLRRHVDEDDNAATEGSNQPQDEPPEAPSPAKSSQQP